MASFSPAFRSVSDRVHADHEGVIADLNELEAALDDLAGSRAGFAVREATEHISRCVERLSEVLPEHFRCEDTLLLETVAKVSPELAEFAREMREQHRKLAGRVAELYRALERCSEDRRESLDALNDCGQTLVSELRQHIVLEETELSGFI
jgi:hemerythrin-like domain-containing protein